MIQSLAFACTILACIAGIQAQIGLPCHSDVFQITPRHRLNISRYMGDWYLHEIAGSDIGNFPAPEWRCAKRSLSLPNPDDLKTIEAIDFYVNTTDGVQVSEEGGISVLGDRSPINAMWNLTHEGQHGEQLHTEVIILWADLEFEEWTVQYSCALQGPDAYRYEVLLAMTRSPVITVELRSYLKALMVGQGFRIGDHHSIDQTNC